MRVLSLVFGLSLVLSNFAVAQETRIAVAANFRAPLEALTASYTAKTGHVLTVSAGSTGQLFAQIANGAPFDVFLSADQQRPTRLIEMALAQTDSQFTYAEGQLYLLMHSLKALESTPPDLQGITRIAIANPRTAPYGAAALQVLAQLHFPDGEPQIAQAQSISGVNAAMTAGAVDAGFAAYSSVATLAPNAPPGWLVPRTLHDPIRQDAVLLTRGADNPAATGFLAWLKSPDARTIIARYGYHVD